MTVFFHLDGIAFTVSGTRHGHDALATFDVHSVHIQGNVADLRKKLNADFLECIAEAAAVASEDGVPFALPQPVFDVPTAGGAI
jgi:hypothetical protein